MVWKLTVSQISTILKAFIKDDPPVMPRGSPAFFKMAAATDVTPRRHDPTSRPAPLTSPPQRHPWRHAGTTGQFIFPSHLGIVRTVIPGWRGQSERLAVASRSRLMQQVIPGLQVLIGRLSPYINPLYTPLLSLSCCTPPVNRTRNTSASPLATRLRVLSIFSVSTPAGPYTPHAMNHGFAKKRLVKKSVT
jgi:hypothetical protein